MRVLLRDVATLGVVALVLSGFVAAPAAAAGTSSATGASADAVRAPSEGPVAAPAAPGGSGIPRTQIERNRSALRNLSRQQLVRRVLDLQRVLRQTEERNRELMADLQIRLNDATRRNNELRRTFNQTRGELMGRYTDLQVRLNAATDRSARLQAMLAERNETISELRDQLNGSGAVRSGGVGSGAASPAATQPSAGAAGPVVSSLPAPSTADTAEAPRPGALQARTQQRNVSDYGNMSKPELINRTLEFQRVLRQTEERNRELMADLQTRLNRVQERNRELERAINGTQNEFRERNTDLQRELNQVQDRNARLESMLEQRNETVDDLRQQLNATATPTASPTPSPTPTASPTPSPTPTPTETTTTGQPGFGFLAAVLALLATRLLARRDE